MKTQPTEWENSSVNNASDKGLISKTTNEPIEKWAEAIDIFPKKACEICPICPKGHENMLNIANYYLYQRK